MFVIDEGGSLRRVRRLPSDWDKKAMSGWRFLAENRVWDADEREAVILAIEQLAGIRDLVENESDAWLKRRANEYCQSGSVTLTADPDRKDESSVTTSSAIRRSIVNSFRRDLIGPLPVSVEPVDFDLEHERLNDRPSRWYLAGFIAPTDDPMALDAVEDDVIDPSAQEELDPEADAPDPAGSGGAAGDNETPEAPNTSRRFLPSSIGLTVLVDPAVAEIEANISWGDYRTEPPLPESILIGESEPDEIGADGKRKRKARVAVDWVRSPKARTVPIKLSKEGRASPIVVSESAAEQRRGGGLQLESHSRIFEYVTPDGTPERVRALTVFLVNRRAIVPQSSYADVSFAFQARLELVCSSGFQPRRDLSGMKTRDVDLQLADLHYRDIREWAVGRNAAAGWSAPENSAAAVQRVWTEPLPLAEVERVAPNEDVTLTSGVVFGMEDLAEKAADGGNNLSSALATLPTLYETWIVLEREKAKGLKGQRQATASRLIADMETARDRISAGIAVVSSNDLARTAFRFMNASIAMAARRRNAGANGDPAAQRKPEWRPFQLAFILLNLAGLVDKTHPDREKADLLFFPTGGGKTEAYLGLAAFVIALRRVTGPGILGAGVAVIMRYTLRLLTLDQLARAAGVALG
jgi:hypothetical protein